MSISADIGPVCPLRKWKVPSGWRAPQYRPQTIIEGTAMADVSDTPLDVHGRCRERNSSGTPTGAGTSARPRTFGVAIRTRPTLVRLG
jgi:hypothetical protein